MCIDEDSAVNWTEGGPITEVDEIRYQGEMLDHRIDAFLRSKGWKHTSSTPGCIWLWEREIGGRLMLVDRATALSAQAEIEASEPVPATGTQKDQES